MSFTFTKPRVTLNLLFNRRCLSQCIRQQSYYYENRNILNLHEQGLFEDMFPDNSSNEIKHLLVSKPQTVYAGFDPTAESLHIGNLLILKNLLHWQRSGHQVIVLIGTATAQIGDPSGRTKDREAQVTQIVRAQGLEIKKNIEAICSNHEKYFWSKIPNCGPLKPIIFVNNEDWYKNMNVIDFLNGIGRHFRMGTMLLKESVNKRLNSNFGMCFTEFTYQVFQAYDWYHLYKNFNCKFQIGGKDQMGNIVAGHNFISRYVDKPAYGLTLPLITDDAGDKFGKSVPNPVWIDPKLMSAFDFYQFFIRSPDSTVEKLLNLFTFRHPNEIQRIMADHKAKPEKRSAQTALADEVTLLVHGEERLEEAKRTTQALYSNDIESLKKLSQEDLSKVLKGATIVEYKFRPGINLMELVLNARVFIDKPDAQRISTAGGLYVNLQRASNLDEIISQSVHILPNRTTIIRVGKRNFWIVKWILDSF